MSVAIALIMAVLVISLIILTTVAVTFYRQREECYDNPSIWCFDDWECTNPDAVEGDLSQVGNDPSACLADERTCILTNPKYPARILFQRSFTCQNDVTSPDGVVTTVGCGDFWDLLSQDTINPETSYNVCCGEPSATCPETNKCPDGFIPS